jgi:hypothetical protein
VAPGCSDAVLNGTETDLNCGGDCDPCALDGRCVEHSDCATGLCSTGTCALAPHCAALRDAGAVAAGSVVLAPAGDRNAVPMACEGTISGGGWTLLNVIVPDSLDAISVSDGYCPTATAARTCGGHVPPVAMAQGALELLLVDLRDGQWVRLAGWSMGEGGLLQWLHDPSEVACRQSPCADVELTEVRVAGTSGPPVALERVLLQRDASGWALQVAGPPPADVADCQMLVAAGLGGRAGLWSRTDATTCSTAMSSSALAIYWR